MTAELVIFIIVAAVAIFSAAFMLVSQNAVHSALLLVTNFICVAFFYLMLNAPFLAMIQVTVYAGAIMVLFMFVIMLLGADKLGGGPVKYPWMLPGAVGLTTIFLLVAFVTIVQGKVGLLKPVPHDPQIQFIHVAGGASAVDVYLNNDKVASKVAYNVPTGFAAARAGDYNLEVFPSCTETDPAKCADPIQSNAAPITLQPVKLDADTSTTFMITGTPDQLQIVTVPMNLGTLDDENTLRVTAINALPQDKPVSLLQLNLADPPHPNVLVPALNYGDVSPTITLPKDTYSFAWQRGNERIITLPDIVLKNKTYELLVLAPEPISGQAQPTTRPAFIRVNPPVATEEAYGSPQQIGVSLLSTYLLPFELVSLLLLAAMVGAIILTREETVKRERRRLVVSPAIRRMNRAMTTPVTPTSTETASTEPSAD